LHSSTSTKSNKSHWPINYKSSLSNKEICIGNSHSSCHNWYRNSFV